MAKWTEARDKAADKRAGIKEGSKKDQQLDKARGLPPDVVKKGVGAGHAANKRNPLGAGNSKKGSHGMGCGCASCKGGLSVGAGADKKNWISGAIKHPGALHRQLGVPQGQKIPAKKLAAAANSSNP